MHPLFTWTMVVSLMLVAFMVALIFWKIYPIGVEREIIPLHYNAYFGVDLLGPWFHVFYLPAIGLVCLLANLAFARLLFEREHLLSILLAVATMVIEVVLLVALVLITLLNL